MKKHLLFVSALVPLSIGSLALAAENHPQWELDGSSNSFLSLAHTGDNGGNDGEFNLGTHAYYFVTSQLELGAYLRYDHTWSATSNSATTFRILASPVFNFSEDPLSSFFARGGLGLYRSNSNTSHTYNTLGYSLGVGKRFPITSSVSWTPEFEVSGHTRATDGVYYWSSSTNYSLTLFQFSIIF